VASFGSEYGLVVRIFNVVMNLLSLCPFCPFLFYTNLVGGSRTNSQNVLHLIKCLVTTDPLLHAVVCKSAHSLARLALN